MSEEVAKFLLGTQTIPSGEEIARQNRRAIHYLALGGIPVGLANAAAQIAVLGRVSGSQHNLLLLGYFCILLLLDRFVIPRDCPHATLVTYLAEAPIMLLAILLGTIWDPAHDAITILMFLIIMPVFILDRPLRVMGISVFWTCLFLLFCHLFKVPEVIPHDTVHAIEFLFSSLTITVVVLRLRFEVVENLASAKYHLVHDVLTDTFNHTGLEENAVGYLGKQLFMAMGDVDHLSLINDFYGKEVGNQVLVSFAEKLKESFGPKHTYRLGGDELLSIGVGMMEQEGIDQLNACRESLAQAEQDEMNTTISYSFGYVTGIPQDLQTLRDMMQLANIYAHQAERKGEGTNVGGAYSIEALREGIAESTLIGHAQAYEINQLTGFPAMAYFINRVEELLGIPGFTNQRVVVGYFNLVDFRGFNDRNGYTKGDDLIRTLADLFRAALPQRHVAYLTGSRFIVFCYKDEVAGVMQHLSDGLANYLPDQDLHMRAGFAEHFSGDSVISLIDRARLAHDNVAPDSSEGYRFYDHELDREIRLRHHLVSHIDRAIEMHWLLVHYQPIIDSATGKLASLEALSRWNDPIYGLLPPYQFIGVLEDESLIYKLSKNVVRQALQDLKTLVAAGLPLVPVSVNLSRKDFFVCDMVEEITALVDASGLPHSALAIEITESAFVESTDLIKREVDRFRARGFAVWMDDFGSEYSTLNLLQDLNFDLIKLDMRFMRQFSDNDKSAAIVSNMIHLCSDLGMTALIEGVETSEQYEALKEMGADRLQGYLFSPPRPLADVMGTARLHGWL